MITSLDLAPSTLWYLVHRISESESIEYPGFGTVYLMVSYF